MADGDLAVWIGQAIGDARKEHGWTQRELARRLAASQSAVARLESGRLASVDVKLATTALRLLGIRSSFDGRTLGLAGRREQRDVVHAACAGYVARRLRRMGWQVRLEVEIGADRSRGWIDLLGFHLVDAALLVGEVKAEIRDVGAIQRITSWYGREAWRAARAFGWEPRRAATALLVLASDDSEQRLLLNHAALRASFPARATELAHWLRSPKDALVPPSIALIDPRSRRSDWLVSTRSEGRRSPLPYRDYADAARVLTIPRARRPRSPRPVRPPSDGSPPR